LADIRLFIDHISLLMAIDSRTLLKVDQLTKSYGGRKVVNGVSFEVASGSRVAIMGPSGSGKTTLINCVGGIEVPTSGSISFDGEVLNFADSAQLSRIRKQSLTNVFQFFHLLPHLTLSENVEFPLLLTQHAAYERKERVKTLLEEVSIEHRGDAFPHECSGGEIQRAAIARALVVNPKLILADEPTGNLDSKNGEKVLDLLESLSIRHHTAVILVTHSLEATRICNRLIEFRDGRIESDEVLKTEENLTGAL
jgi:putative ABC transport system ATP-binding protein